MSYLTIGDTVGWSNISTNQIICGTSTADSAGYYNVAGVWPSAAPTVLEPDEEDGPESAVEWLDRRVDEMRFKL